MDQDKLYQLYSTSSHGVPPVPQTELFSFPSVNFDIYEDESQVVNRLFYVLPLPSASSLFVFFEDNLFVKDALGDLALVNSSLNIWSP